VSGGEQASGASRRENDFSFRHCERKRSNPEPRVSNLDCFVASLLAMTTARNASREGISIVVIAGLDPAIMRSGGLLTLTALFCSPDFSMDHRGKPGGDDESDRLCLVVTKGGAAECVAGMDFYFGLRWESNELSHDRP
jgi:hypothetical protein